MLQFFFLWANTIIPAYTQPIEEAKSLRDKHRADEARRRIEAEEARKRAVEDEERRRILDDAKMEAEAKPGMVWNKEAREYQYVHDPTEESWRD